MDYHRFLCLIIDRDSKQTLKEYEVNAVDSYYARHQAANQYVEDVGPSYNWYVDSLDLGEVWNYAIAVLIYHDVCW